MGWSYFLDVDFSPLPSIYSVAPCEIAKCKVVDIFWSSQGQIVRIPNPGYAFRHVENQIDCQSCSGHAGAVLAACSPPKRSSSV